MGSTKFIDLLRNLKKYALRSIAVVGEQADLVQCEFAAYLLKVYANHIKFFPTDSEAPIASTHDLLENIANRRSPDMLSALTTTWQWFNSVEYHSKKVLFVLSKHQISPDAVDRFKQLKVDIVLLTRSLEPSLPLPNRSTVVPDQWFHIDTNQFHYLAEYASQQMARVDLIPELTLPNTLALCITGCDSARGFTLQMSENTSLIWHTMSVNSRTLTVQNLTPGGTYCVRVKAVTNEEWLTEYSDVFRFTLPTAIDVTPFLKQPKPKKQLESAYKEAKKVLCDLPGHRLTLVVQGNKREEFIRALQNTMPASKSKKSSFQICFASNQQNTVGVYYTVLAIDPKSNIDVLVSQFNAVERVPWPLYIMLIVNAQTCCALSEGLLNRLCDTFRITRNNLIVVREDDEKQVLLPLELLVGIMKTLCHVAEEEPNLFDVENEAGVFTHSNGIINLWDLFDKHMSGETASGGTMSLFKCIQWHPPN